MAPAPTRTTGMVESLPDFVTLLKRARQGDTAAFRRLAEEYEPKLRMIARVRLSPALRPYLDSMDLVQSVHRSLMVGFREEKYDISTPENLLALALTMVRRKAARHWRHLRRQQRLDSAPTDNSLPNILQALSGREIDPAQAAAYQDGLAQLCQSLGEIEKSIIELRLNGHTTAEIAQHVRLSPVALRVRMTRLRQRLESAGVLAEWL